MIDRLAREVPAEFSDGIVAIEIPWHGRAYRVAVPPVEPTTALFLILDGLGDPPPGDAVVVVKPAHGLRDLLRRRPAPVQMVVRVTRSMPRQVFLGTRDLL